MGMGLEVERHGCCSTQAPRLGRLRPPPEEKAKSERTLPLDPAAPLRRISIEIERRCNLECLYCYTKATADYRGGLSDEEVRFIIREAIDCGARAISIVAGGEALLRRTMLIDNESFIDYSNARGAYTYLYTNCTLINERTAQWLAARDVTVVGKFNSLREKVQDELVGVEGAARRIRRGVDNLLAAGLADETPSRLGLETVVCRQNYDELPEMWRWMRQRNIVPEVEIVTDHGRAAQNRNALYFAPREAPGKYRALFEELLRIDETEFGYTWVVKPPFAAATCELHFGNVYVNDQGGVQPCAGIDAPWGFMRVGAHREDGEPLRTIATSEPVNKMRHMPEHLHGACATCDLRANCYGCRAAAFHAYGDMYGEDPTCWRSAPYDGPGGKRSPLLRVVP